MRCILLSACICTILPFRSLANGSNNTSHIDTFLADIDTSQNLESELMVPGSFLSFSEPQFSYKTAAVHFISKDGVLEFGDLSFEDPTIKRCASEGYKLTSCANGSPAGFCPYNTSYFKECCTSDYQYTSCSFPLTKSSDSCGGKYRCYCDASLFPVTKCASPQVAATGSGSSCTADGVTRYSDCVCPASYSEVCIGINQQGKGTGCTKNGTTKYTGCECKPGYTLTCSDLGPSKPSDYCQMNGIKYYNECKTCPNKCSLASCPAGVVCEYEECSKKYCDIGCAVGYRDLDNYWCNGALRCLVGR